MEANEIIQRYDNLVQLRKNIDQIWDTIARTMMPYRGEFFRQQDSENSIDWRRQRNIYDGTAPQSIQTLAASLHGSLTSPAVRWFDLEFRDADLAKDKEAQEWMDNCNREVYSSLQDSNFNLEINETYTDVVGFGSSVLIQEEDDDYKAREGDFQFQAIPVDQSFFEQDHRGRVCNFYRRLDWTPLQIVSKFGSGSVPTWVTDRAKYPDQASNKIELVMCIYKRSDKQWNGEKMLAPKERPYGCKYVIKEGRDELGEERGYYEMPAYIPRWRKTSDSMWGNSPAMMALPDVLTLNGITMTGLKYLDKVVDPATMVTERGLLSNLDLRSGGLTVVRSKDDVWSHESRGKFSEVRMEKQDLKAAIRSAFYVDQLELKDSPAMTATEVQVRYELMQRLLGPTLGRLVHDLLSPLIERSFNMLMRADRLGEMPESVIKAMEDNKGAIDVKYTGPLARAQRKDTADSVVRFIGTIGQMSEVYPEMKEKIDSDEVVAELASLEGVPAKVMKGKAKLATQRKNREQVQSRATEAEIEGQEIQNNKVAAETEVISGQ